MLRLAVRRRSAAGPRRARREDSPSLTAGEGASRCILDRPTVRTATHCRQTSVGGLASLPLSSLAHSATKITQVGAKRSWQARGHSGRLLLPAWGQTSGMLAVNHAQS